MKLDYTEQLKTHEQRLNKTKWQITFTNIKHKQMETNHQWPQDLHGARICMGERKKKQQGKVWYTQEQIANRYALESIVGWSEKGAEPGRVLMFPTPGEYKRPVWMTEAAGSS